MGKDKKLVAIFASVEGIMLFFESRKEKKRAANRWQAAGAIVKAGRCEVLKEWTYNDWTN